MLTKEANAMRASDIIGADVRNFQDEDLGKIEDFVIDGDTGRLAYAVLSFGGVFGVGEKLFAVPFQSLNWDTERQAFTMDAKKERLKNAPGFDSRSWPKMGDRKWGSSIHQFYGVRPFWE